MRLGFLLFLLISFGLANSKSTMAVLDLRAVGGLSPDEVSVITGRLEGEVIRSAKFRVLERNQISTILSEQGFQQSGVCDSKECQVQVGQLLGVSYLLTGVVGRVGSITTMEIRLVDVETGEIVHSNSKDVRGGLEELLLKTCKEMALSISVQAEMGKVERHVETPQATPQQPEPETKTVLPSAPEVKSIVPSEPVNSVSTVAENKTATPAQPVQKPAASVPQPAPKTPPPQVEKQSSLKWWLIGGVGVIIAAAGIYVALAPPQPAETQVVSEVIRTTSSIHTMEALP